MKCYMVIYQIIIIINDDKQLRSLNTNTDIVLLF